MLDPDEGSVEYAGPHRDPWRTLVLMVPKRMPLAQVAAAGLSERASRAIINVRSRPRPAHREALIRAAAELARVGLPARGARRPADGLAAGAAYPTSTAGG